METKNVYVCYNPAQYTKEGVELILLEEGYGKEYKFYIGKALEFVQDADEFWTFGNCNEIEAYKKAVDLGLDIWVME